MGGTRSVEEGLRVAVLALLAQSRLQVRVHQGARLEGDHDVAADVVEAHGLEQGRGADHVAVAAPLHLPDGQVDAAHPVAGGELERAGHHRAGALHRAGEAGLLPDE